MKRRVTGILLVLTICLLYTSLFGKRLKGLRKEKIAIDKSITRIYSCINTIVQNEEGDHDRDQKPDQDL